MITKETYRLTLNC